MLRRLVSAIARFIGKRWSRSTTVTVEDDGFALRGGRDVAKAKWEDVREIVAFKRDLFTVDLVCLAFRLSDEGDHVEVNEEMPGYRELVAQLERRFQIGDEWWSRVAFPAFETNLMTLWGEPKLWRNGTQLQEGNP